MTLGLGSPYYPDDIQPGQLCIIEGHAGPNCRNCGEVNYAWLGYNGAVRRYANAHGLSFDAASDEMNIRQCSRELHRLAFHDGAALSEQGIIDFDGWNGHEYGPMAHLFSYVGGE